MRTIVDVVWNERRIKNNIQRLISCRPFNSFIQNRVNYRQVQDNIHISLQRFFYFLVLFYSTDHELFSRSISIISNWLKKKRNQCQSLGYSTHRSMSIFFSSSSILDKPTKKVSIKKTIKINYWSQWLRSQVCVCVCVSVWVWWYLYKYSSNFEKCQWWIKNMWNYGTEKVTTNKSYR